MFVTTIHADLFAVRHSVLLEIIIVVCSETLLMGVTIGDTRRFAFEAVSKDNVLGGTALPYSRTLLHINRSVLQASAYLLTKHPIAQLFYLEV